METTRAKVNEDIEILKSDVRKLRDDVAGRIHSAKSHSRDTIMETGDRMRDMMADLRDKAKEQFRSKSEVLRDKSEALKDRGRETMENWRGGIEHRPMTALAIAFAVGLVFGSLVARRRY